MIWCDLVFDSKWQQGKKKEAVTGRVQVLYICMCEHACIQREREKEREREREMDCDSLKIG